MIGGSGFIGTRLCKRLRDSDQGFAILDKRRSSLFKEVCIQVDVRDKDKLLSCEISDSHDVLVNLAAEHRDDVHPLSLYDEVNVGGAIAICEFADSKRIRNLVFTSSVAVYGFADRATGEDGEIKPFNDYGRTKYEAELVYREWQAKDPQNRSLTIIRPTVVFGEQNRGNVYNLFRQIATGRFVMIGSGQNCKSMAYVENVAAFIQHSFDNPPGVHTYNYLDKPDFDMNSLVCRVKYALGKKAEVGFRLPYLIGMLVGYTFDLGAKIVGRPLPISSIRVKKFCKESTYSTTATDTGFEPPVGLRDAIDRTIKYEFASRVAPRDSEG